MVRNQTCENIYIYMSDLTNASVLLSVWTYSSLCARDPLRVDVLLLVSMYVVLTVENTY